MRECGTIPTTLYYEPAMVTGPTGKTLPGAEIRLAGKLYKVVPGGCWLGEGADELPESIRPALHHASRVGEKGKSGEIDLLEWVDDAGQLIEELGIVEHVEGLVRRVIANMTEHEVGEDKVELMLDAINVAFGGVSDKIAHAILEKIDVGDSVVQCPFADCTVAAASEKLGRHLRVAGHVRLHVYQNGIAWSHGALDPPPSEDVLEDRDVLFEELERLVEEQPVEIQRAWKRACSRGAGPDAGADINGLRWVATEEDLAVCDYWRTEVYVVAARPYAEKVIGTGAGCLYYCAEEDAKKAAEEANRAVRGDAGRDVYGVFKANIQITPEPID